MIKKTEIQFTGERVVEGSTPKRIWIDHEARYKFASRYVKGKKVLDIACGTGYGLHILCDSGAEKVVGVDISSETIEFAQINYQMDGLEFKVGNILYINLPKNYFDVVTCFETIEHVQSQEKAFMELKSVLKPMGLLIISSPNRKLTSAGKSINDQPANPFHTKEYLTMEFISVLDLYFNNLAIYGQRSINKLFFLPFFERIMREILPVIYDPRRGNPELEKVLSKKEYRYITVVCQK
jgi:ubiquinone/menaquinone biosynthesis C-methylase UbiE